MNYNTLLPVNIADKELDNESNADKESDNSLNSYYD